MTIDIPRASVVLDAVRRRNESYRFSPKQREAILEAVSKLSKTGSALIVLRTSEFFDTRTMSCLEYFSAEASRALHQVFSSRGYVVDVQPANGVNRVMHITLPGCPIM